MAATHGLLSLAHSSTFRQKTVHLPTVHRCPLLALTAPSRHLPRLLKWLLPMKSGHCSCLPSAEAATKPGAPPLCDMSHPTAAGAQGDAPGPSSCCLAVAGGAVVLRLLVARKKVSAAATSCSCFGPRPPNTREAAADVGADCVRRAGELAVEDAKCSWTLRVWMYLGQLPKA